MFESFMLMLVLVASVMLLGPVMRKRGAGGRAAHAYAGVAHCKGLNTADSSNGMYRAVSCVGECTPVRALEGKRFLEREAPMFPLPGCDAKRCDCIYNHHSDRRNSTRDRRSASKYEKEVFVNSGHPERRNKRGRRATDMAMA